MFSLRCSRHRPSPSKYDEDDEHDDEDNHDYEHDYEDDYDGEDVNVDGYEDAPASAQALANIIVMVKMVMMSIAGTKQDVKIQDRSKMQPNASQSIQRLTGRRPGPRPRDNHDNYAR